jgi:hypothetical protein
LRVRGQTINRAIRLVSLLLFAVGCGLLLHRLHRTPEQTELTRYVQKSLPSLFLNEQPIDEAIARLGRAPGLKPEEARTLLVDDVIPRLVKLRRQAESIPLDTAEGRALNDEYLKVTDQLIDACRACVHVIDDPQLPAGAGLVIVRERFAEVRQAYQAWDQHVRQACVRHRLAQPITPAHG